MTEANHSVAAEIFVQLEGEAVARRDYERFLMTFEKTLDQEDVKKIQEIQADEANHMLILQAMAKKYDGGISASIDGASQAISEITIGIGAKP